MYRNYNVPVALESTYGKDNSPELILILEMYLKLVLTASGHFPFSFSPGYRWLLITETGRLDSLEISEAFVSLP